MSGRWALLLVLMGAGACSSQSISAVLNPEPPKQAGTQNPMAARGQDSFAQRQKDCWDMPSAQACHDVGLNYELGLVVQPDVEKALEYYDKACSLERQDDHCEAAKRLRERAKR